MENKNKRGRPALVNNLTKDTVIEFLDDLRLRTDVLSNHLTNNWGKADLITRKVNTIVGKFDQILDDLLQPTPLSDDDLRKIRFAKVAQLWDEAAAEAGLCDSTQSKLAEMRFFLEDYINNKK